MIFDLLIKNGYLINGTGNPWFRADIGVKDGRIKSIKRKIFERARKIIDAKSLVVSPGFIDVHAHDDLVFFYDPFNKPKLKQGVTTVVCGNCGISPAPLNKKTLDYLKSYVSSLGRKVDFTWSRYGEFLDEIKKIEIGINVAGMVGHGTLRIAVMGMKNIAPTKEELTKMKKLLAQSLEEGAIGMSTGLIYPPGEYAKTEELIELCKIITEYGGIYTTHLRNEGDRLLEAMDEAIRISSEMIQRFQEKNIKIIKVGLHSDIEEKNIVAGPYHHAFGELVRAEILKKKILNDFEDKTLMISSSDISL